MSVQSMLGGLYGCAVHAKGFFMGVTDVGMYLMWPADIGAVDPTSQ
jgi:hypothetical protein